MREPNPVESYDVASKSFSRARREALLRRAWALARHSPDSVRQASFYEARSEIGEPENIRKFPLGVKRVSVAQIRGSVSRSRDFDDRFLPLNNQLRNRWESLYRSFKKAEITGVGIPPVSLYMVGGQYFVKDGNHRVSVASFLGIESIEAEVTLLRGTDNA